MIDVKEAITILCKCLHDTIDSQLTPEHFRTAKYNKSDSDIMAVFWTTLDKLSYFALKELNDEINLCKFDKILRTKLRMAFLQYPAMEFYGLPGSRALMICLVWLITKYHVLKNVVRLKVINSSLGREFSKISIENDKSSDDADLSTVENQVNKLMYKSHKLGCNLKAISELHIEKVKLTTRVHAASLTTSGLPHLTVSEMSLTKKLVTNKMSDNKELKQLKEMEQTASMLDTYMKWIRKNNIFFTWMNTVIDESEKEVVVNSDETLIEISKFICVLKYLIKKRIKSLKNKSTVTLLPSCPSRFFRAQKDFTEVQECLAESKNKLNCIDKTLEETRSHLENTIFNFLPNFYQI